MSKVEEALSNIPYKKKSIWTGPESNGKQGGVTQSLLGRFISCPERFRALVCENLRPHSEFNHRMEYGTMFHLCCEVYTANPDYWKSGLKSYCEVLCAKYPFQQEEILKWYNVCLVQFPVYLDYWKDQRNPSVKSLLREQVFHVPYKLPSGRTVYLRGRWDAVELHDGGIWLVESKTKGDVDPIKIQRRLTWDLQTMLYLIALRSKRDADPGSMWGDYFWEETFLNKETGQPHPIRGVRYNVIRRPLSGGKGTIKQTKNETVEEYYDRLAQYIKDEPETYFFRWESEITATDIANFEQKTLIPVLERLCTWFHIQSGKPLPVGTVIPTHFTMPFGVPAVTDEYGTEYDEWILSGSENGLEECTELFPELNGER